MAAANIAPYEFMSPTLLSQQPATAPERLAKTSAAWILYFNYLERRLNGLRSWRWSWWAHWAVLARFFSPRRFLWFIVANKMWRGNRINDAIIDSNGLLALRTCGSGLYSGMTPEDRPWFKYGIALPWIELDQDAKAWLQDTEERANTVLAQSNFYPIIAQGWNDVSLFGTAPVLILEDFQDVARFYLPCAGEFYVANGGRMSIDTFARDFTMTVQQIVDMFQIKNCPKEIVQYWNNGKADLDREYVVAHMIEPNFPLADRSAGKNNALMVPSKFTWREIYWLKNIATEKPLSVKGFNIKPFMVLRGYLVANEPYGRSFAMDALGDTKQVQVETIRQAEFIEKGVRPPMGADPSMKNEPASIMPGMITYTSAEGQKKGFWPLFEVVATWVKVLSENIAEINERIDRCFFVNLFKAITQMEGVQPRNELELTKRDLERLQELGPVVTLALPELDALHLRLLDIMERRNLLKPKPASLQNVPLKITYISILRVAQRSAEYVGMKDFLATMGGLSSAAKAAGLPDPLRKVNLDKTATKLGDVTNFPSDLLFSDDEVKAHDAIRAKAMQQAQAPGQAMAAVDAAKTLSDTQLPGGNSALGALIGGPAGGAGA